MELHDFRHVFPNASGAPCLHAPYQIGIHIYSDLFVTALSLEPNSNSGYLTTYLASSLASSNLRSSRLTSTCVFLVKNCRSALSILKKSIGEGPSTEGVHLVRGKISEELSRLNDPKPLIARGTPPFLRVPLVAENSLGLRFTERPSPFA